MGENHLLITLLLSTTFSLISFIIVTTLVGKQSKKIRDEYEARQNKRIEEYKQKRKEWLKPFE